ncbi:hypothetical protein NL676_005347 [Syzygium grande]|nr:hypothetical protein NL676_005347 [Syzygium grande]
MSIQWRDLRLLASIFEGFAAAADPEDLRPNRTLGILYPLAPQRAARELRFGSEKLNELMESKGGKKKSSSSKSLFYEAPLGYSIEDVRPHGGIKKFRSAAYSNCVRKPS